MHSKIKITALILGILSINQAGPTSEAVAFFQKGNTAYQAENYQEAIEIYQTLLDNGYHSGALYYNLGNAYYKIGEIGEAILNYKRALKWRPHDSNIQFNLRLAQLLVKDRIEGPPEFFLFRWHGKFINLLSSKGWGGLFSAVFLLTALWTALYYHWDWKRFHWIAKRGMIVLILLGLLTLYALITRYNLEVNRHQGVIVSQSVRSLAAPQTGSTELFIIHEGTEVEILDRDAKWIKIELIDGKQGWIPQDDIGII